jgi:DNA-binding NtrC family response regulator/tetratricopeptide (TPR) repeat protein
MAIVEATRALQSAMTSGHARTRLSALGNLGTLHLLQGKFTEAQEFLARAMDLAPTAEDLRTPLLDSFAQLKLATGEWKACEELIERHDQTLTQDSGLRSSWYEMVARQTKIRLLNRLGSWERAREVSESAIALADRRNDRFHSILFRVLAADAELSMGHLTRATDFLRVAFGTGGTLPLEVVSELERVKAKAFAAHGAFEQARLYQERAARIIRVTGNAFLLEVAHSGELASHSTAHPVGALCEDTPSRTSLNDAPCGSDASPLTAGSIAAILDLASNAELLGHEAFEMARAARCARALALVATASAQPPTLLALDNWSEAQARAAADQPDGPLRLPLGTARGREVALLVDPLDDIDAREWIATIRKLVSAALSLEQFKADQLRRTSLWPIEDDTAIADGIFVSKSMLEILEMARKVARVNIPVLLTGETGTGKEILARAVHRASPRAARPFVPFNCNAVPDEMLDSQLFGYRRGAFTGAQDAFPGVIKAAAGGTLFIDELGELNADVQPKLLRFLETGEVHPLGEPQPEIVDVRVIAATNADLDRLVSDGVFREDLFYRLNVVRFRLPPVRERREEIPLILQHYIRRFGEEFGKGTPGLADETLEYLLLYSWPGNVRQMVNEVRRMVALAEPDAVFTPDSLTAEIRATRRTVPATAPVDDPLRLQVRLDQPLAAAVEHVERTLIARALETSGGRVEAAAEMLGISRKGLYLKRQRLGLGL